MNYMFNECINFDCDLSNWDVSNVVSMEFIFSNCDNFKGKGLDKWNVSNVKHTRYMFFECPKFYCDLSDWDVSNVIDMQDMFYNCDSLKNKPSWYKT